MHSLLIALGLMTADTAVAQAPQQASQQSPVPPVGASPEIVVRGTRNLERQVSDFVRALNDVPASGQISRFDWAVCPTVIGLSGPQNARAATRMRNVAKAAGIKVAEPGCKGNVLLAVTDDKAKFVKWLSSEHPTYFEGVSWRDARRLADDGSPAAAWHVQGMLDADGAPVALDRTTGQYSVERTDAPSRISTASRPHFSAALVVVDSKAAEGLTVVQLADYAAMRAFARTDPARVASASTILTILDAPIGSAVPITLTNWDLAYLKALYATTENRLAGQQRHEINRQMTRELAKPSANRDD